MQSVKSPGRELAEKMWRDVTGRIPSGAGNSPPREPPSGEAVGTSAPVLGSFPDLDQPAPTDCGTPTSDRPNSREISPTAIATIVAGSLLCILVVWIGLFARQENPERVSASGAEKSSGAPLSEPTTLRQMGVPQQRTEDRGNVPVSNQLVSAAPHTSVGGFGEKPAGGEVSAEAFSDGWAMDGQPAPSVPNSVATGTPPWSVGDAVANRREAELAALLTGQELKQTQVSVAGDGAAGSEGQLAGPPEAAAVSAPQNQANPLGQIASVAPEAALSPSMGDSNASARIGPREDKIGPASFGVDSGRDVAAERRSGQHSAMLAGEIRGTAWLRGEKEFVPRGSSSSLTADQSAIGSFGGAGQPPATQGMVPAPVNQFSSGSSVSSTHSTGPPAGQVARPALPPGAARPPETPTYVANLPQGLGTSAIPSTGILPPAGTPGWNATVPIQPATGSATTSGPQVVINPTVVTTPAVIPASAWQAIDASSFRWGNPSGVPAAGSPMTPYQTMPAAGMATMPTAGITPGGGNLPPFGTSVNGGFQPAGSLPGVGSPAVTPGNGFPPAVPAQTTWPSYPATGGAVYPAQPPLPTGTQPTLGPGTGFYR